MPGKYGQASQSDPSGRIGESTRPDRKKGVLVNTPTHIWVYTRSEGIQRKGKKRSRPALGVSPRKWDVVYLDKKSYDTY